MKTKLKNEIQLREYQKECLDIINSKKTGNYLIQMATGLGKTVTFSQISFKKKMLIISHREELVFQPAKYFNQQNISYSVEMGKYKADQNCQIISTCIATMRTRYKNFDPEMFDVIIWDECHHMTAKSYKIVFNYFKPHLNLGFTATPNRADNQKLDDIFDEIIYKKDLLWGIKNNYLSNIYCKRCYVKFDLRNVRKNSNDYNIQDLENELLSSENAQSVGKIYKNWSKGQTLIFGISVKHCEEIQKYIPDSVVISASTKNRAEIIKKFTNKEIPCIINCMIFTEGTDLPLIETIIIARPTKSESLYTQMVGRGLRLHSNKQQLMLIDCVGVSTDLNLITAPSLIGITYNDKEVDKKDPENELECNLFDLPQEIIKYTDTPEYWKVNWKEVNLWANKQNYNLHNVNWFKHPDGSFSLSLSNKTLKTGPINELGKLQFNNRIFEAQELFDKVYLRLVEKYQDQKYIWDLNIVKRWGRSPASEKQLNIIKKKLPNFNTKNLSKLEACQILNRLFNK